MQRQPELHVSALSPQEFRAYTRYLDLIALTASRESGSGGLDADGTVRFDRSVVRDFCTERLGVPKGIVDDVLARLLPSTPRLAAGNVYAVLRLLGHIMPASGGKAPGAKALDPDLVFVPGEPLPLDPAAPLPLAPPRRAPSLHHRGSRSISGPAIVAPKPLLPPRRAISPPLHSPHLASSVPASTASAAPSSPPRNRLRKSLPAGLSLDPFRDTPSPSNSPSKARTLSSSAAVGSNNPFRMPASSSAPTTAIPPADTLSPGAPAATATHAPAPAPIKVGPPLPPRKPSLRRPAPVKAISALGPALPPRQIQQEQKQGRARGDSVSSNSTWSDSARQPTSTAQPSDIMQQSFAAAAAGELSRRKENKDPVVQVIDSSSPAPPVPGRRDIIDTVTRAVRESEADTPMAPPPPPPLRAVSSSRLKSAASSASMAASAAFNTSAEKYRVKYPALKTWSPVGLLADRPQRTPYAMIILNQPITHRETFLRAWASSTVRICADGGANALYDVLEPDERPQLLPTMIKGDLDSVRPDVKNYYASRGVAIKRDPSEYATDLMKCISEVEAIESASGKKFSLLLFGGLSGRLDQTIGVMSQLLKMRAMRRHTFVISEESLAWVLDKGPHLIEIDHGTMGQTCGILPVGVTEAFVRTEGLKWDLDWVTGMDGDLSTSNHLLPANPAVFLETSAPVFWTVEIRSAPQAPAQAQAPPPPMPSRLSSSQSHGQPQSQSQSQAPTPASVSSSRAPSVLSPADELSRGVKELGSGFVRAASGAASGVAVVGRGLGRRLSSRQGSFGNGDAGAAPKDWERERDREREAAWEDLQLKRATSVRERIQQKEKEASGLIGSSKGAAGGSSSSGRVNSDDGGAYVSGYALLD